MIDVELLRKDPERFREVLRRRNYRPQLVDEFLALDEVWRKTTAEVDKMRADQKKLGAERRIEEAKALKDKIQERESELDELALKRGAVMRKIPNIILEGVPAGKSEADNITLREVGQKPEFDFPAKDYVALAEKLGVIDVERAGKVSGSRFGYILGDLARIEIALAHFVFNTLADRKIIAKLIRENKLNLKDAPFIPVIPPVMIKKDMMAGMGYVERGGDEIYELKNDELYLVGTSEQSIGPMHADETLDPETLPRRYVGFSACFRREAGSHGKDVKGILRVHQFNKSEMFSLVLPETSADEHKLLLAIEEHLMKQLELPYRVLNICSADLGDPAAAKYDLEAWMPVGREGQGEYRETHSTSNTTEFQSRRLGIRYRKSDGKSEFVHMLNGTAFSERPLLAIIENNQTKTGSIRVPKILAKLTGIKEIRVG